MYIHQLNRYIDIIASYVHTYLHHIHILTLYIIIKFGGLTLKEAMDSGSYAVYVGMTRQSLHNEYLGFLTTRGGLGANGKSVKGRPILMRDAEFNRHFTGTEAKDVLGAVGVEVFKTQLRVNASAMEDKIQKYMKETLNVKYPQRLFRDIAKGKKCEDEDTLCGVSTIHRTFLTIFKIATNSADWGEDEGRARKSYPKSVRFENAKGEETTVFVQA